MPERRDWFKFWYRIRPRPILPKGYKCIYALAAPITQDIRYIGCTKRWPFERIMEHFSAAIPGGREIATTEWIRSLQAIGLMPSVLILELLPADEADKREIELIADFDNLLNVSKGGPGSSGPMSVAHREVIRRGVTGSKHSNPQPKTPEHRAKISAALTASHARRRNAK